MASDKLLFDIQQASADKAKGVPGADIRLMRLIRKLRNRGVGNLKKPIPPKTMKEDSTDE